MQSNDVCILYDDPQAARDAWESLRGSELRQPVQIGLHQGEISQDAYGVARSGSRMGALMGALLIGGLTAVFLGVSASSAVLGPLSVPTAMVVGLLGGGLLGFLTGMLVGATEPPPVLARVRQAVRRGRVALVARFADPEHARRATQHLASQPGAVLTVAP